MKRILFIFVFILQVISLLGQTNFSFVFLPDIHLRPDSLIEKNFDEVTEKINSLDPDFLILGGDMIYTAKDGDEKKAQMLFDFMDRKFENFKMPFYYTMGNHEVVGILPNSGIDSSDPVWGKGLYEKRYCKRYYSFEKYGWKFYVLDGIKILKKEMNYTSGVDSVQIAWLKDELLSVDKNTPLVVIIHTPLVNPKSFANPGFKIISSNAREVLDQFKDHNLRLVLQGHNHVYMNLFYEGIYYISGGSTLLNTGFNNRGFTMFKIVDDDINVEFIHTGKHSSSMNK